MDVFTGTLSFLKGRGVYGEPIIEHVDLHVASLEALLETLHTQLSSGANLMGMSGMLETKVSVN